MASLPQLLLLAFPMVLAGTGLTAVVGYYVIPYNWPWSLAATLGSILASTDPVAVGSVLKKAGAPPRLQMHVSGESLLNDGSAVRYHDIMFLYSRVEVAVVVLALVDRRRLVHDQNVLTFTLIPHTHIES
jgi:NhaP-type Na+/H+ and K+/H+ antiporter